MLTYVIVVNDNGELKMISQTDVQDYVLPSSEGQAADDNIEAIINEILDRKSAEEFAHDGEIAERLAERRDMTDGQ